MKDMIVDILIRARYLVKLGWCQDTDAATCTGHAVNLYEDNAANFCAVAALYRARNQVQCARLRAGLDSGVAITLDALKEASLLLRQAACAPSEEHPTERVLVHWNDHADRDQEEVLQSFTRAIESARAL